MRTPASLGAGYPRLLLALVLGADLAASCPSCTTLQELSACTADVNRACCRSGGCESGEPAACDKGCEGVLLPMSRACVGFLDANYGLLPISAALGRAAVVCEASNPPTGCDSEPCLNGATCTASGGNHACACTGDWKGAACGQGTGCDGEPCQNGATCTASGGNHSCACANGWAGANCSRGTGCDDEPCQNGATCTPSGNKRICSCSAGWSGDRCDVAALTDTTIHAAVAACLVEAPMDGNCSSSAFGPMARWDVGAVTDMSLCASALACSFSASFASTVQASGGPRHSPQNLEVTGSRPTLPMHCTRAPPPPRPCPPRPPPLPCWRHQHRVHAPLPARRLPWGTRAGVGLGPVTLGVGGGGAVFQRATAFDGNISAWNTSAVMTMSYSACPPP
jgi:hypothetical protein